MTIFFFIFSLKCYKIWHEEAAEPKNEKIGDEVVTVNSFCDDHSNLSFIYII